jgi:hypothetical protein
MAKNRRGMDRPTPPPVQQEEVMVTEESSSEENPEEEVVKPSEEVITSEPEVTTTTSSEEAEELTPEEQAELQEAEAEEEALAPVTKEDSFPALLAAAKAIKDQMADCDRVIKETQQRKEELRVKGQLLQNELQEALSALQKELGGSGTVAVKRPVGRPPAVPRAAGQPVTTRTRGEKPIRQLILEYLQDQGQARTSEIRKYLQSLDRYTNPGVELSRMVREQIIVNVERGLYAIVEQ